ncbi:VIT1/CCC1 transporter family protein [Roseimaritima sediminicola]|uniref:VIT1/CCC1 transporter family protein n=1 Tax=Roseimaritima sediminicola TaxID=2662066 RepID=UPI001298411A|nr:VIT1/CCC1 transporter family protein [Roseimaritima sediminicola]
MNVSDHAGRRERLVAEHSAGRIRRRLRDGQRPDYLPDFVYGAIDGTVTTFAVVSGVAGAELSSGIVIVLGLANLVGDGFSMAASNFLGTRVEQQLFDRARAREVEEIELYPEGEREEIRQIFAAKGFEGQDLERAVEIITADRDRWVDVMMTDEIGLSLVRRSPWKAALATMVAFLLVGFLPLLSFVVAAVSPEWIEHPYRLSCWLTGGAFVMVGAVKARFVEQSWVRSALETLALGAAAASLAYLVGAALAGLVDG